VAPDLIGPAEYEVLVIGWGSTYHAVREALGMLGRDDISFLHFSQVYPVHPRTAEYLSRARVRIIVEDNATAQFARLVRSATGIAIENKVLKYDGLPFSAEEVAENIRTVLEQPAPLQQGPVRPLPV
jgi:2-oxoglutarate ferredoxin oxidoreductase subunit alpha